MELLSLGEVLIDDFSWVSVELMCFRILVHSAKTLLTVMKTAMLCNVL